MSLQARLIDANHKNYNTALELACECATCNCEHVILRHKKVLCALEKSFRYSILL